MGALCSFRAPGYLPAPLADVLPTRSSWAPATTRPLAGRALKPPPAAASSTAASPDAPPRSRAAPAPGIAHPRPSPDPLPPRRAWARRANALPASLRPSKRLRGSPRRHGRGEFPSRGGSAVPAREGRGRRGPAPPRPAPSAPRLLPPPGPAPVTMTAGGRLPLLRAASPPPAPPLRPRC